jgi:hypothetical protein
MVAKNFDSLLRQLEQLMSQQRNWDTLNAASEKINMVYKLLENADEEDQQELRQQRERTRTLEAENAALQKRLKDADVKLGHADKNANTALQTLTQAQQRSSEWELRAREHEGQLEMVRTQLEQAEQTHTQLEADYNIAKVQLEEHQADSRLAQVSLLLRFQFHLILTSIVRIGIANSARKSPRSKTNVSVYKMNSKRLITLRSLQLLRRHSDHTMEASIHLLGLTLARAHPPISA